MVSGAGARTLCRSSTTGELDSTGQAGDITINTNQLTISGDGATIFSATQGSGQAGNISIQTRQLQVNNGAQIVATTLGDGLGGNIDLLAESIQLVGTSPTRENPSGLLTSTGTPDRFGQGTAPAGNIQVRTGQLQILDGARISASSQNQGLGGSLNIIASQGVEFTGTSPDGFFRSGLFAESRSEGEGGNIHLSAPNVRLDNGGTITTETASNNGGNISLAIADTITLRRQSSISATAGRNSGQGDGGNIDLNTKYLFAIPVENSDITANAFFGTGGNITITARGIFGIEFRPELTPLSDITVSSAFGVDGVVTINNPDADPSQGLFELPTRPIDASRLVILSCLPGSDNNQFIVTGRGGLPPNPTTIHTGETPLEDLGNITLESSNLQRSATIYQDFPTVGNSSLVEAQGLVVHSDGRVSLIARSPHSSSPSIPWLNPQCRPTVIP
ncbi:S-layer family protein [Limnospira fusiformis KN01]|uniref:S-layer family protein n=2 Tax=Limnospira fusiformis TaxID=54297 RepID=A0ABU9EFA3_LIMFS|nr:MULTISPECIES: S-layer family protein [Limnospira]MDT9187130.1 S-layer family protein [Limnospira sp. PMC 894.15]MDT9197364.1 S-layer family protein [Limnospira sp. PMC 1042.18]MDT9233177.1 S-layer family protein [Limnospira sp. PMC 917.15]MDT9273630.1 S-layer family protein [Limnospira sp. PMC 737.11]ULB47347.1 S-layer family protein [Limnospira fusiformis KN01]